MATMHLGQNHRHGHFSLHFDIRRLPASRPIIWLYKAWEDLLHHRAASLAYGLLVSLLGALMLIYQQHPYFIAAYISLFLVLGPLLAAGLIELSRCSDLNQKTDFENSLSTLARHRKPLLIVASIMLSIALVLFVLTYTFMSWLLGGAAPSVADTLWYNLAGNITAGQALGYFIAVSVLSIVVFALSVVTIPMIIDRHVSAVEAMRTSIEAFQTDLSAMLVWGGIISLLILIGFVSNLIFMPLIFPLLGHATWYAYKDLVKD